MSAGAAPHEAGIAIGDDVRVEAKRLANRRLAAHHGAAGGAGGGPGITFPRLPDGGGKMAASNRRAQSLLLPFLTPIFILGCDARSGDSGHTVADSAGIRIVTLTGPAWEHDGWRIAQEPLLDVGLREGDDDYLFNGLTGITLLEDGGIVVANGGDNTIRHYDANGTFVWKAGGTGGGPEEYAAVGRVKRLGDRILALDQSEARPDHVYDLDGRHIGTVPRYEGDPRRSMSVFDVFPDGSYLYSTFPQGRQVRGERWVDSATVFRVAADRSMTDSLLRLPAVEFARLDARMGYPVIFAPIFMLAAGDGVLFANYPDDCDIGVYDFSATELRRIRWSCPIETVPEETIERYKQEYLNGPGERGGSLPPALRAQREALLARQQFAERYPAHGPMRVDGAGNLWVQRTVLYGTGLPADPLVWDVFDAQGILAGAGQHTAAPQCARDRHRLRGGCLA